MSRPKTSSPVSLKIANFFGGLGYIAVVVQWMWSVGLLLVPLGRDGYFDIFLETGSPRNGEPISIGADRVAGALPDWFSTVIAIVVVIAVVALTVYALVSLPRLFGKAGKAVTQSTANVVIPRVEKHRHITLSKPQQRRLRLTITWSMKLALIIVPPLLLLVFGFAIEDLSPRIALLASLLMAGCSLLWFGVQFAVATLRKLPARQLW